MAYRERWWRTGRGRSKFNGVLSQCTLQCFGCHGSRSNVAWWAGWFVTEAMFLHVFSDTAEVEGGHRNAFQGMWLSTVRKNICMWAITRIFYCFVISLCSFASVLRHVLSPTKLKRNISSKLPDTMSWFNTNAGCGPIEDMISWFKWRRILWGQTFKTRFTCPDSFPIVSSVTPSLRDVPV